MSKLTCKNCNKETDYITSEQVFTNGSKHIRATCKECNRFIRYLPQDGIKTYIPFGKFKGMHTYQVTDADYLKWFSTIVKDNRLINGINQRIKELNAGGGHG